VGMVGVSEIKENERKTGDNYSRSEKAYSIG
jgi:hypothetical protein